MVVDAIEKAKQLKPDNASNERHRSSIGDQRHDSTGAERAVGAIPKRQRLLPVDGQLFSNRINEGLPTLLGALAEFCHAQGLWFHVDAAYGGPAARTKAAGKLFEGLERADSVAVNPHKWLYVPAEAGCILVRESAALRQTFQVVADYLKNEGEVTADAPAKYPGNHG